MTAFSRQFACCARRCAEFDPAETINIQGHDPSSPIPAVSFAEVFHGARAREKERTRGRERQCAYVCVCVCACAHFARSDNARVARPTCRQWVGMNDLQALKCMNEQPERNVRLDGARMPLSPVSPAIAHPREFMASKRPDASAPRQIAFERFFNPSLSHTRPISRSNCTPLSNLRGSRRNFSAFDVFVVFRTENNFYQRKLGWHFALYVRRATSLRYILLPVLVKKDNYSGKNYEWETNYIKRRSKCYNMYYARVLQLRLLFRMCHNFHEFILSYIFNLVFINYIFDKLRL